MKRILLILLILSVSLCETNNFTVDNIISEHIEKEEDNFFVKDKILEHINSTVKSNAALQYEKDMDVFVNEFRKKIETQTSKTKQINTGVFSLIIQEDCSFLDEIPPEKPSIIEKDCFTGQIMAQATANLIIQTAPTNPPNIEILIGAVSSCKLELEWSQTFSVLNECYKDNLREEYLKILQDSYESIENFGFTKNEDGTFQRGGETSLMLDQQTSQVTNMSVNTQESLN